MFKLKGKSNLILIFIFLLVVSNWQRLRPVSFLNILWIFGSCISYRIIIVVWFFELCELFVRLIEQPSVNKPMIWPLNMWPSTKKGTSCRPGLFWDNEQNSVQNIKKIKGNTHFLKVVLSKVSLKFSRCWYHWKAC